MTYRRLNPIYWSLFLQIAVIALLMLFVDGILGVRGFFIARASDSPYIADFISLTHPEMAYLSLSSYILIGAICPVFNDEVNHGAFYGALLTRIILEFACNPFTWLGVVAIAVLNIMCGVVIVITLVFAIMFGSENPLHYIFILTTALSLKILDFFLTVFLLRPDRSLLCYTLIFLVFIFYLWGFLSIYWQQYVLASLIVLITAVFDNFIMPWDIEGIGVGDLILLSTGIILSLEYLPRILRNASRR